MVRENLQDLKELIICSGKNLHKGWKKNTYKSNINKYYII